MTRLDEIEARLAAATPGPWRADQCGGGEESFSGSWVCPGGHANGVWSNPAERDVLRDETSLSSPDAELIAHAPEDIAALLAVVKAVRTKAEDWAALAPGDDWGEDIAQTIVADAGRGILATLDAALSEPEQP